MQTGYPSIDRPWLKWYNKEEIAIELPRMTAVQYFEDNSERNLSKLAIDAFDGQYTYQEFKKYYYGIATSLYAAGIQKGNISLFVLPPMALESALFYAANTIGSAVSGLPPQSSQDDICKAINDLNIKLLFILDILLTNEMEDTIYRKTNLNHIVVYETQQSTRHNTKTISFADFLRKGNDIELPNIKVSEEDLVFIARTGGTTGEPKSVMLNSNNFNIAVHQLINSSLPYASGDRWLRLWPLFSATAIIAQSHLTLSVGMSNIVRTLPPNFQDFDELLLKEKPNHLLIIPQLMDTLEKSNLLTNRDLSFIKSVACGGLGITNTFENRVERFLSDHNINSFLGYGWGCTENSAIGAMRTSFATARIGTAGIPQVTGVVAAFDPDTMRERKYGEEGELCINSHTLMMGYYNAELHTNTVLKRHDDGKMWLHTGDLGFVDEEGFVTVCGRMTRVIFTTINKVYPAHLENDIAKVAGVREVAVCEMPDPDNAGFFLPVCFIVPDSGCNPQEVQKRVVEFCEQTLADYARPRHIFLRDSLPLTKVGKIDIIALEKEIHRLLQQKS